MKLNKKIFVKLLALSAVSLAVFTGFTNASSVNVFAMNSSEIENEAKKFLKSIKFDEKDATPEGLVKAIKKFKDFPGDLQNYFYNIMDENEIKNKNNLEDFLENSVYRCVEMLKGMNSYIEKDIKDFREKLKFSTDFAKHYACVHDKIVFALNGCELLLDDKDIKDCFDKIKYGTDLVEQIKRLSRINKKIEKNLGQFKSWSLKEGRKTYRCTWQRKRNDQLFLDKIKFNKQNIESPLTEASKNFFEASKNFSVMMDKLYSYCRPIEEKGLIETRTCFDSHCKAYELEVQDSESYIVSLLTAYRNVISDMCDYVESVWKNNEELYNLTEPTFYMAFSEDYKAAYNNLCELINMCNSWFSRRNLCVLVIVKNVGASELKIKLFKEIFNLAERFLSYQSFFKFEDLVVPPKKNSLTVNIPNIGTVII